MKATFANSLLKMEKQSPEAWSTARAFLTTKGRSAYFWGSYGTGKTFAAECIVAKDDTGEHGSPSMVTAPEFVRTMRLFEPGRFLMDWKLSTLWVLDDIDKANWKPADIRSLWEILDARQKPYIVTTYSDHSTRENTCVVHKTENLRKTIITGNVHPEELRAYLNRCAEGDMTLVSSLMQRLHPMEVVEFKGESLR